MTRGLGIEAFVAGPARNPEPPRVLALWQEPVRWAGSRPASLAERPWGGRDPWRARVEDRGTRGAPRLVVAVQAPGRPWQDAGEVRVDDATGRLVETVPGGLTGSGLPDADAALRSLGRGYAARRTVHRVPGGGGDDCWECGGSGGDVAAPCPACGTTGRRR